VILTSIVSLLKTARLRLECVVRPVLVEAVDDAENRAIMPVARPDSAALKVDTVELPQTTACHPFARLALESVMLSMTAFQLIYKTGNANI
jgi:hypothetical protein